MREDNHSKFEVISVRSHFQLGFLLRRLLIVLGELKQFNRALLRRREDFMTAHLTPQPSSPAFADRVI